MMSLCNCHDFTRRSVLLGGAAVLLQSAAALGQSRWQGGLDGSCSFYPDDVVERDLYTFGSNEEAFDVVRKITNVVGLEPNFEVLQANVPNAAAVIRGEQRYILFSQVFIRQIVRSASTEWASWTILAHEVGHHLNGHTLTAGGSRPPIELQADRFAGHAIKRLGGSLDDALACFRQMSSAGSATHPPRSARLEAVSRGWHEATASGAVARPQSRREEPRRQDDVPKRPSKQEPAVALRSVKRSVSRGYLNMRTAPGTNANILTRIPAGAGGVRYSGRCAEASDGTSRYPFCYVEWNGYSGWVSSNGLQ